MDCREGEEIMPVFNFITRIEVMVEADTLDEAVKQFNDAYLGDLDEMVYCDLIKDFEFHSVQEIQDEDGNPIDRPMRGGDIK